MLQDVAPPRRSLLIVEDDLHIRLLLHAAFRRSGIVADIAVDGLEAAALVERASYDVMLLDLMLPGLSGFQLLQQHPERLRGTIVIVITAFDERVTEQLPESVHAVVRKPFDVHFVVDLVTSCVQGMLLPPPHDDSQPRTQAC